MLAVQRLLDGYTTEEVAEFFGIAPRSVRRWHREYQLEGWSALEARLVPGRPRQLSCTQEKVVRRWLAAPATEHGFVTELWSGPRLAQVIAEEFGIEFHPDYLGVWMRQRGYTPQRPQRVAREHDSKAIALWHQSDWSRIKKKRCDRARRWA
jgi:transposase